MAPRLTLGGLLAVTAISLSVPLGAVAQPSDYTPAWMGDYCETQEECGWDDHCFPRRCQSPVAEFLGCDESWQPPGTCSCVENQCMFLPNDPTALSASEPGCASDSDCALDVGTGRCHLGGRTMIGPITQTGPLCLCDEATTICQFELIEPVACDTFADCWYAREPRLHPIPASEPRSTPVDPCVTGEIDSVCVDGFCQVVGWSC